MRNRKTRTEYSISADGSLTPLNMFAKRMDYSPIEEFIQQMAKRMPATMPAPLKEQLLNKLRQQFVGKEKEIKEIIDNPQAISKTINECSKHAGAPGFLQILAASLLNAQVNSLLPGLGIIMSQITAGAAQAAYTYPQGQPVGGEYLCDQALHDCIKGYLTEIGKDGLPQIDPVPVPVPVPVPSNPSPTTYIFAGAAVGATVALALVAFAWYRNRVERDQLVKALLLSESSDSENTKQRSYGSMV
jgi:hypothetical protein